MEFNLKNVLPHFRMFSNYPDGEAFVGKLKNEKRTKMKKVKFWRATRLLFFDSSSVNASNNLAKQLNKYLSKLARSYYTNPPTPRLLEQCTVLVHNTYKHITQIVFFFAFYFSKVFKNK